MPAPVFSLMAWPVTLGFVAVRPGIVDAKHAEGFASCGVAVSPAANRCRVVVLAQKLAKRKK
jgi:hypothetical protein